MNSYRSLHILSLLLFCMVIAQWLNLSNAQQLLRNSNRQREIQQYDQIVSHSSEEELIKEYMNFADEDAIKQNVDWDVIIFTQQWPVTLCYHWKEEDKDHRCVLPTAKEFWTIHGIWPTKLGHVGPNFCNKSADFDLKQLTDIESRLEHFWPDIDGNDDQQHNWLWRHEWLKHGTCAALLEDLNNELKYFQQGLQWREMYNLTSIFETSNILPDSVNTVIALQSSLYKSLGKNPSIHCVYDHKKDVNFLSEIRVCFDKQLQLIDCDGVKLGDAVMVDYPGGSVITNCHISKPVYYPSNLPPLRYTSRNSSCGQRYECAAVGLQNAVKHR